VLDAVVGVFLTQNVSDALSSKAWMTLAAAFPLRPPARRPPARGPAPAAAVADGPAALAPAQSAATRPGAAAAGAGPATESEHAATAAAAAALSTDAGTEPESPRGAPAEAGPASGDECGPGVGSPHTPRPSAGAAPRNAAAVGVAAGEADTSGEGPRGRTPVPPASADPGPAQCGGGEAADREAARQPDTPPVKEGHRAGLAPEAPEREVAAEGRARAGSPPAMPVRAVHPAVRLLGGADPAGGRQSAARPPKSAAAAPGPPPARSSAVLAVAFAAEAGARGACEAGAGGALARRDGAESAPGAPGGAAWDLVGADAEGGDYGDSIDWEAVRTAPMEKVRAARLRAGMRAAPRALRQPHKALCASCTHSLLPVTWRMGFICMSGQPGCVPTRRQQARLVSGLRRAATLAAGPAHGRQRRLPGHVAVLGVRQVAEAIRCRGMYDKLAARIQVGGGRSAVAAHTLPMRRAQSLGAFQPPS